MIDTDDDSSDKRDKYPAYSFNTIVPIKIQSKKIENKEACLLEFDSNMKDVIQNMKSMFRKRCNGWAALAIIYGSDKITEKINSSTGTISLICGLFLSASIPLVLNPPNAIADLHDNDYKKYCYLLFMGISVIFHSSSIFNTFLLVFLKYNNEL